MISFVYLMLNNWFDLFSVFLLETAMLTDILEIYIPVPQI